ncbi:glycosyltransferase 1 domain-containing protein 1-like [Ruditapes philippinarum]|uniref:glycosyltransferase 1 domain-containing protein 1-like n=1 Tax=Ruditapes philippinarum TaxID=129788 RepID=UPI00295BE685|nr:glycosyltransferase 1 domain-containing protein 1-like [Ruditapes philippinarum]
MKLYQREWRSDKVDRLFVRDRSVYNVIRFYKVHDNKQINSINKCQLNYYRCCFEMKVLLLSPLVDFSGNFATVTRIKKGLEKKGLRCFLKCSLKLSRSEDLKDTLDELGIDIILAVHVYKSGKILIDVKIPYILILGGTDVNELTSDHEKMDIMTKAVNNSRHIVAFGESLAVKFKSCWPNYDPMNVSIIPQGVEVFPNSFSITSYIKNHAKDIVTEQEGQPNCLYGCDTDLLIRQLSKSECKIFTIVGGIRSVKNPLFLIKTFSDWRMKQGKVTCWLLFVGAHQNDTFFEKFKEEVRRCPGVVYIPALSTEDAHALIQDSFALVNCSDSEGMALAILEAMALKTLVIARNIPGNTAVVDDGQNGIVFDTPENFIEKVENLLEAPEIIKRITEEAFNYISNKHSVANEENAYFSLLTKYC